MFDEENLLVTLSTVGFKSVRSREYDAGWDLEERRYETMYASEKYLRLYLVPERLQFYRDVATEIAKMVDLSTHDLAYLDVGCGTGLLMEEIRQRGMKGRIVGCDHAETCARVVGQVCPVAEFKVADIYGLGYDQEFDFATAVEVLELLEYPDVAVRNMLKALKPGGKLFVTVPDGRKDTWEGYIHFWSPKGFKLFLERFGPYTARYFDDTNFGCIKRI